MSCPNPPFPGRNIGLLRKNVSAAHRSTFCNDLFKEFKGALTENYALCELISLGVKPYYWKSRNIAEVDFVAQFGMDIVPIEVKSERNLTAKSLAEYRKSYAPRVSIKTSMANVSGQEVKIIPLYMLWKLDAHIKD